MRIHLFLATLLAAALSSPARAETKAYRYTYNYWAGGVAASTAKRPPPTSSVTVEISGEKVRAETPTEIFVINTRSGELLYINQTAKTFGYAQLDAYMSKMRKTVSVASDVISQLPKEFRELAEKQKAAKGSDPLLWVQTTRRSESGGVKCAVTEGRVATTPVQAVCSDKAAAQPVAPQIAQLETTVVQSTGGERITGVFGGFPWPLDFPFSSYGVPVVIEKTTSAGSPLRTYLELKGQEPLSPDASRYGPPAGFQQVDLFPAR